MLGWKEMPGGAPGIGLQLSDTIWPPHSQEFAHLRMASWLGVAKRPDFALVILAMLEVPSVLAKGSAVSPHLYTTSPRGCSGLFLTAWPPSPS